MALIYNTTQMMDNEIPVINLEVYNELGKYVEKQDMEELYEEFEKETSGFFEELKFLVPANNHEKILSILHTLKGTSGSLGVVDLADKSKKLEDDLRRGLFENLPEAVRQLEKSFIKFQNHYREYLNFI